MSTENIVPSGWEQYETKKSQVKTPSMEFGLPGDRIKGVFTKVDTVETKNKQTGAPEVKKIYTIQCEEGFYNEIAMVNNFRQPTGQIIQLEAGKEYAVWGKDQGKSLVDKEFADYKIGDNVGVLFVEFGERSGDKSAPKYMKTFNFGPDQQWLRAKSDGHFGAPAGVAGQTTTPTAPAGVAGQTTAAPVQQALTPDNFMSANVAPAEDMPWDDEA